MSSEHWTKFYPELEEALGDEHKRLSYPIPKHWHATIRRVAERAAVARSVAALLDVLPSVAYDWLERQERLDFDKRGHMG